MGWRGKLCCIFLPALAAICPSLYPQQPAHEAPQSARAVIDRYCTTCHNAKLKTAGVVLEGLDTAHIGEHAQVWEKAARKLRTQEMPPPGLPRPDPATYRSTAAALESALDAAATASPNPGSVAVHRLNRNEYSAAIRDLLGFEINGRDLLPADEVQQEGFDNIASVLSISPALMENYLSAAREISRLAVGDSTLNPVVQTVKIPKMMIQNEQQAAEDLPFGSQGGTAVRYHFPLDGEYTIKVLLKREEYDYLVGMGEPNQLDVRLDGALLKRFPIGGDVKGKGVPESYIGNMQGDIAFETYMHTADANLELRTLMKAGDHTVGVSFVRRRWEPEGIQQPPLTGFGRSTNEQYHGYPGVEFVYIGGPYGSLASAGAPSRRKIFVCDPASAGEEACAQKILSTLGRRAYRRPLTESDLQTLLKFYRAGREGRTFDAGIQRGIERILAAPSFLFRVEREPAGLAPGSAYRLTDLEIASRLSFFLWSSIPDDALLDSAVSGKLRQPGEIERQVRRMLHDPRSSALVDNFANRWLELSKLSGIVPDSTVYPDFDENLRDAMATETRLFVASQLHQDRSVLETVTANYTYLNERLARHYGVPGIYGNRFRRVTFNDGVRGGLLGQASMLTVTSYPNRTSVVMRGKWLLSNLLGAPPPPPPPDVPALKDPGVDGQPRSLRERMELHRKNAVCASCHQRMDPLGFSLENFDALGAWRTESDGVPVDAAASMPDGYRFQGIQGLRELLLARQEDFVRTVIGKLLEYAIGRGLEYTDEPAIRKIARDSAEQNYTWSSILAGVARSVPFTMASAAGDVPASAAVARPATRGEPR
jgi:hypothetical protein